MKSIFSIQVESQIDVQLQQCQIRVAVVCLVFALLHDIVLEYACCLGIVPVEPIKYLIDVFRPLGREVERDAHDVLVRCATDSSFGWGEFTNCVW